MYEGMLKTVIYRMYDLLREIIYTQKKSLKTKFVVR